MKKRIIFRFIQAIIAIFLVILIQRCGGDDSVNPSGTYMGGTITYTNTNLVLNGGYYAVSFYGDSTNPLSHTPIKTDSLAVGVNGGLASVHFKESGLPTGNYYIASTWVRSSDHARFILGGFGCDITLHCPAPTQVAFPNYAGTAALDFLSKTDPSSPIYP
jgi:hypothetical protein